MIVWVLLALQLVLLAAWHRRARLRAAVVRLVSTRGASAVPAAPAATRVIPLWASALGWLAAGAATALLLVMFAPYVLGGSSFTVMSGSMSPAIGTGDVVVDQHIRAADAKVGDVVTFRDPEGSHKLITHRVRRLRVGANGVVSFVTKGDASNGVQRWSVPAGGSIGLVRFRIPYLGYALWGTRQPLGRLVLVILPALLLAFTEVRRLWRPQPVDPAQERPGAAPL